MSSLTDQEEYGEHAGGKEPGPVHVVEDVVRVQPQVRDGEVQLLHRHVVLAEHFKMAPRSFFLPTFILRHFIALYPRIPVPAFPQVKSLSFVFLFPIPISYLN